MCKCRKSQILIKRPVWRQFFPHRMIREESATVVSIRQKQYIRNNVLLLVFCTKNQQKMLPIKNILVYRLIIKEKTLSACVHTFKYRWLDVVLQPNINTKDITTDLCLSFNFYVEYIKNNSSIKATTYFDETKAFKTIRSAMWNPFSPRQ